MLRGSPGLEYLVPLGMLLVHGTHLSKGTTAIASEKTVAKTVANTVGKTADKLVLNSC